MECYQRLRLLAPVIYLIFLSNRYFIARMAKGKKSNKEPPVPPSVLPPQGISLLERQLERIEEVLKLRFDDPKVDAFENTTVNILHSVFGKPDGENHENTYEFRYGCSGPIWVNMDDQDLQESHIKKFEKRKALLVAFIEQLKDLNLVKAEGGQDSDRQLFALKWLQRKLSRLHLMARQLRNRRDSRPTIEIEDEYDVQYLVHAVLRLNFDDIREEDAVPSYAGKNSRVDFLLKDEKIVVEIKKTRKGLADKELGSELIEDIARYKNHPDCKVLVCFIYDVEHRIGNPTGLRNDLQKLSSSDLKVEVVISPN